MKLTGKTKADFEEWLFFKKPYREFINENCGLTTHNFNLFPEAMQWGVYVDFFNSKELKVDVTWLEGEYWNDIQVYNERIEFWISKHENTYDSLQEARTAAIEKANEIYNSN